MIRLSLPLVTCLLLLFCNAALSQSESPIRPGAPAADRPSARVLDDYMYPKVIATKMDGESNAESTSASEEDGRYSKFRMRQLEIKEHAVFLLCVVAILAHWIVMGSLRGTRLDTTHQLITATGLIYVIFGTILLVLLALTDQQLTAATGILGAIAGYLFGSSSRGAERVGTPGDEGPGGNATASRNAGPAGANLATQPGGADSASSDAPSQ